MIVQAKAGTGKTLVFGIICLDRVQVDIAMPQVGGCRTGPASCHLLNAIVSSGEQAGSTLLAGLQVLILAPTHEIALQSAEVLSQLALHMPDPGVKIGTLIGGLPIAEDQKLLRRCVAPAVPEMAVQTVMKHTLGSNAVFSSWSVGHQN